MKFVCEAGHEFDNGESDDTPVECNYDDADEYGHCCGQYCCGPPACFCGPCGLPLKAIV